jgi:hypothetical protein
MVMNRSTRLAVVCAFALGWGAPAHAQATSQPSQPPAVTADGAAWYVAGEPIVFAGNLYRPAGPQVYFNPHEMVRTGFHQGVPLYTKTTLEPYSIVFVPLQRGLMQPYERPRTGDIAGTVGSTTPSFPVSRAADAVGMPSLQAAAPPMLFGPVATDAQAPVAVAQPAALPTPVGTTGVTAPAPTALPAVAVKPSEMRRRPSAIFVEVGSVRYFTSGEPIAFDPNQFVKIGEHEGFPVYARNGGPQTTIYLPLAGDVSNAVTPFSARTARRR